MPPSPAVGYQTTHSPGITKKMLRLLQAFLIEGNTLDQSQHRFRSWQGMEIILESVMDGPLLVIDAGRELILGS